MNDLPIVIENQMYQARTGMPLDLERSAQSPPPGSPFTFVMHPDGTTGHFKRPDSKVVMILSRNGKLIVSGVTTPQEAEAAINAMKNFVVTPLGSGLPALTWFRTTTVARFTQARRLNLSTILGFTAPGLIVRYLQNPHRVQLSKVVGRWRRASGELVNRHMFANCFRSGTVIFVGGVTDSEVARWVDAVLEMLIQGEAFDEVPSEEEQAADLAGLVTGFDSMQIENMR